jgi:2-methylisocitrate lyase-like PEP mutase family enzyme
MPTTREKREAFRRLHESGCFVIPNPPDPGTARYLQHLGFKALATTSGGFAFSRGLPDGAVPRAMMLAHIAEIVASTDLPVNADFLNGYGADPEEVAQSVRLCVETGVAGLSVEDSMGPRRPQYGIDIAVQRIRAARQAIDESGGDTMLIGRAENFFGGNRDLAETTERIKAYAAAGADCLYAPGVSTPEEITAIIEAAAPKPVNVVVTSADLTVNDLAALGVRRLSIGGMLALAGWAGMARALAPLTGSGSFAGFSSLRDAPNLNALFSQDQA